MYTGVQWTGSLNPNETKKWFTFNWNPAGHIVWYVMPTSVNTTVPELQWSVAVERASPTACTYWITVQNLTNTAVTFEGRYAVLS
jgi:hypothetical protein